MLDVRHQGRFPLARGDKHLFIGGEICGHNVVIATWPKGHQYGVGSAAELASDVKRLFRKIWFALLVGIAAGIPKLNMADTAQQRDIRLGDVLVAIPDQRSSGIVQYDSAKYLSSDEGVNTVLTGKQAESEGVIRATIQFLEFTSPVPFQDGNECARYLEHLQGQHPSDKFTCPAQQHDILHTAISKDNETVRIIVEREPRPESVRSLVWFGRIGSGNSLVKSARTRDRLRDEHNLIGLEMEAAGIMNILPAGVIRGVCDYADREKDKRWQGYAAGAAAAYAKSILNSTPPLKEETADQRTRHDSAPMMKPSRRRTLIHRSTPLLQDDNESDTDWNAAAHDADTEERVIAERIHGMSYTRDGTLPSPKYSDRHSHTRDSLRKTSHTIQPNSSTRKFGEVPRNQRYQVVSSHSSGAGASKYQSPTVVDEPSPDSKMATSPASEYGTPLRQIKTRGTTRTQVVETGDSSINATTSPGQAIPKRPESDLGQLRDKQLHDIFRDASPCHQHNEAPRISSPQPTDSGNQERSETVFADDDGIRVTPIHAVVERPHGNEDSSATSISVQPMPSPTTKETIVLDTSMDEDRKSIVGFYGTAQSSRRNSHRRERLPVPEERDNPGKVADRLPRNVRDPEGSLLVQHHIWGLPQCDRQTWKTTHVRFANSWDDLAGQRTEHKRDRGRSRGQHAMKKHRDDSPMALSSSSEEDTERMHRREERKTKKRDGATQRSPVMTTSQIGVLRLQTPAGGEGERSSRVYEATMAMLHDAGYRPDEIGQIMQKATSVKGYSDAEFRADLAKRQTRPGISVEQAIDVRTATMRTLGRAQYDQYEIAGIMNQVDFCLWEMKSANRGDGNGDFDRNLRPTQQKLDGMEGAEAGVRETLRIAGYSTGQIDRMLARSEEVVKAEKKTDDKMRRQLLEEGYAQAEINRAMTFDRPSRDQDEQMVKLLWRAGYNMDQIDSILRRAEIRVKIRSQVGVR